MTMTIIKHDVTGNYLIQCDECGNPFNSFFGPFMTTVDIKSHCVCPKCSHSCVIEDMYVR